MPARNKTPAATPQRQRKLQAKADKANKKAPDPDEEDAVQAGARHQPEPPQPKQRLRKPGLEADLDPAPRYLAPDYRGSGKLDGMKALITGGDSGIGRAVAVLFAREGADVAIVYLSEHEDARATAKAVEAEGRRCHLHAGDVRDDAFCRKVVAKAVEQLGGLDVLVNNAAFQQHVERLEDLGDDQLQETLQTNVAGYFHMARAALPHLRQGASIINTGSETALFGSGGLLDYAATKGAIHAFTKSLAAQLLPRGIRVNAVAPGPVWTPLNPADRPADDVAEFGADSDMGRPAQPEEISPAYVFLASPVTASYISGVVLPVMGGPQGLGVQPADYLGWAASAVLLATLGRQVWVQWREERTEGLSSGLFLGQMTASAGFVVYSVLVGNAVFVLTNAALLATAITGQWIYRRNVRREQARGDRSQRP